MTLRLQEQVLDDRADRVSGVLQTLQEYLLRFRIPESTAQPSTDRVGGYALVLGLLRGALESMAQEIAVLRDRDEASQRTITEIHEQMRCAAAIQRDLLPTVLPKVAGLDVHTLFRPLEALSGDLYDVIRVDNTHVGFALADATGHGLPGGVLSTFMSRSLSCQSTATALQPDKVLLRINRDLLDAAFTDCPFVTALYAVYDEPTRRLSWARGGAPHPILVRRVGAPVQIMSEGPLIGAIEAPEFEVVSLTLRPGDTVVFHTDGLEALVCDRQARSGPRSLIDSKWFQRLGERPLDRQIEDLEARLATDASDWRRDDVTVVALRACET